MRFARGTALAGLVVALSAACTSGAGGPGPAPTSRTTADAGDCAAGSFQIAGSGEQRAAWRKWIADYRDRCPGAAISYRQADGPAGPALFGRGAVALVGTESAPEDAGRPDVTARCGAGGAVVLPLALTRLVLAHTVPGVPDLALTPALLAKIYAGTVARWNDPEIALANPGVELPDRTITPVHASGESAATGTLTAFLAARAEGVWTFGTARSWPLPAGTAVPPSRTGLAVSGTAGALGYVDGAQARRLGLTAAKLDLGDGAVAPAAEAVTAAAAAGSVDGDDRRLRLQADPSRAEAGAYPLFLVSYLLTCAEGRTPAQARFVKTFLAHAAGEGQAVLAELGYAPLPPRLQDRVRAEVSSLRGS